MLNVAAGILFEDAGGGYKEIHSNDNKYSECKSKGVSELTGIRRVRQLELVIKLGNNIMSEVTLL